MVYIVDVVVDILISRFLLDLREAADVSDGASSMIGSSIRFDSRGGLRLTRSLDPFAQLENDSESEETYEYGMGGAKDEEHIPCSTPLPEGLDEHLSTRKSVALSIGEEIEMVEWVGSGSSDT